MTPTGTRRSIDRRPGTHARHELAVRLERHRGGGVQLADREVLLVVHLAAVGAGLALGPRPELGPVGLVDVRRAAQDRGALVRSSSRPRRAAPRRPRRRPGRRRRASTAASVSSGRPVAGSRISRGSPVPGRQSARNGSSQPAASAVVCSGAVVAIASSFGRLRARRSAPRRSAGAFATIARCPVAGSRQTGPRASTASIRPSSR